MEEFDIGFDRFEDVEFGIMYLREIRAAQTTLSEAERAAVAGYTELGAFQINTALRTGKPLGARETRELQMLDAVIERTVTPCTFRVSRVASIKQFGLDSLEQLPDLEGDLIGDEAFLSTSLHEQPAMGLLREVPVNERVIVDIVIPEGTHAAYIAEQSHDYDEQELLVVRNARLLCITPQPPAMAGQNRTVRFILMQDIA